jgi:hypothetical protein
VVADPGTAVFGPNATAMPLSTTAFSSFGPLSLPNGTTQVRIYFFNSGNTQWLRLSVDNVTFSGCLTASAAGDRQELRPEPGRVGGYLDADLHDPPIPAPGWRSRVSPSATPCRPA